MDLYQWLRDSKGYSWLDTEETVYKYYHNLEVPKEVLSDIQEYIKIICVIGESFKISS